VHRWCVLLALVGCEPPTDAVVAPAAALYPAAPSAFPLGSVHARIGRSIAPDPVASRAITGAPDVPLAHATPWQVPGDGPARAVLAGLEHGKPAVELVEIDRARVVWRTRCEAPVVGVTHDAIICGDGHGTRALGLDGKALWQAETPFLAMAGDRVITEISSTEVQLRDAHTGAGASAPLPKELAAEAVAAACDAELYTASPDGKLARIANAKVVWTTPLGGAVAAIDACDGTTVVVTIAAPTGTSLVALVRETGKLAGRVDGVRGYWPARDDPSRLEVSTATGVARWSRDFLASQPLELPPLAELLATRGDRRLVRATPLTAVVLGRDGVRAYVPLGERDAALGDDAILAGSRLAAIPRPWRRPLRVMPKRPPVAVPAELRDLPQPVDLDVSRAVALDATTRDVVGIALDAIEPAVLVAVQPTGVARFDLRSRAWSWYRADGCATGGPIGIASARDVVVCATARGVRATDRRGVAAWEWTGGNVDSIAAAGEVVLVRDADRLVVLDAVDGHVLGTIASGDGAAVRAAPLDIAGMTMVVTYEQGRVVARLPRVAMVPAWSIAIAGVVRDLAPSGDGVLVALEDGDAFRIDARTADAVALPGLDLVWRAAGDLVTGEAVGGPAPPLHMQLPREPPEVYHPTDLQVAPAIATPWPPPPPLPPSWQYTLYELAGGLRARNDYALEPPITPGAVRGGGTSPLVVASGPNQRQLLVIEPEHGDPIRRVTLPPETDHAPPNVTFATIVDGHPVAGTILAGPLRVVVF